MMEEFNILSRNGDAGIASETVILSEYSLQLDSSPKEKFKAE